MPGENLTRLEAEERAALVRPSAYEVELDLTRGAEIFGSTTTVRFTGTAGAATFIDAITRTVHSVTLNGKSLDPAEVSDGIRIQLPDLQEENELVVVADGMYTNTGEGLHRFVDPVDDEVYLYTQFEVPDSRRMFAVFEQPDLKATFRFTVTAPARWSVTSNQATPEPSLRTAAPPLAGASEPAEGARPTGDGVATWRFAPTPVISSYITALIAGPYRSVTDELTSADGRTIALGAFARASLFEHLDADYVFEKTKQGFEFYERIFGVPYPFDKYDQLFVPEYNAGAMENAGAVTFTETYVFRSKVTDATRERRVVTILHELAHMWFGDLVTMKWWNDLWLNESFAEFISTLATAEATEWAEAWTTFTILEKNWAYTQDQLPSTHPIVAEIRDLEDVQVNFDGITYAKGASVLKQLVAYVGREPFLAGIHEYFLKHGHGNTTLSDLLVELEATSGRDLTAWSAAWLETAGVNTLMPTIETDEGGLITSFAIAQSGATGYRASRPHRLAIGFYDFQGEKLVRTERFELDVDGESTDVPEAVGTRRPALVLVNDDDLAYAKIRLDEQSLTTAIGSLAAIESPLARSLVWSAVWDATRDAEARPRDFVRLVLNNVGSETESTIIRQVLQQALLVASSYVAPEVRDETLTALGDGLQALARAAEAGSDAQFQFVRALASVARTPEQLTAVRGLLSGRAPLPGLDVDTDLRWELLIALVAGGEADGPEITATLAADDTATGRESAAHAHAATPTPEGKAAAWASVVDSAALPNATVRSTCLGFRRAIDPTLLQPYVEGYFAVVEQLWADRSYAIAETLARGLYPSPLASQSLVDASQRWLTEHPEAPAALRRIVVENTAAVQRALAAQERDSRV